MANLNKVMLIGRLASEPEVRVFSSGGKVTQFRFATNNRKKNQTTGEWEDDPMFIDVKAFNKGDFGKQADLAEQYLHKGHQVFLEGKLVLETWEDKNGGGKRSKHVVVVDNFQFLEPRQDGSGQGSYSQRGPAPRNVPQPMSGDHYDEPDSHMGVANSPPDEDNIPF